VLSGNTHKRLSSLTWPSNWIGHAFSPSESVRRGAGGGRPVPVDVRLHKALMCLGVRPRRRCIGTLNRYRIKRISNLEHDRSCRALHEFRGSDSAATDPAVQDVAIPSSAPARLLASNGRMDGRQRITAFARLIRRLPDGTCTVGRRTSRPSRRFQLSAPTATKGDPASDVTAKRITYLAELSRVREWV